MKTPLPNSRVLLAVTTCLLINPWPLAAQAPQPQPSPAAASRAVSPSNPSPAPTGMPSALQDHINRLEIWAQLNQKDAQNDALLFWVFKGTAIIVSAAAGLLAFGKRRVLKAAAGPIASVLVLLDGFFAPGSLRGVHLLAVSDLRDLQNDIVSKWNVGELRGETRATLAAKLIEDSERDKKRISEYLKSAEARTSNRTDKD